MFDLKPGDVVRFYEIVRLLDEGQGGTSEVYEARLRSKYRNPDSPRRVALKIALPEFQDWLRAEADFLSRFDHPSVVKVYPIPKAGRTAFVGQARLNDRSVVVYMAMEYLSGGSLAARLERRHRLPLSEALATAYDIARALQHIHSQQVINLDIKPENILFRGSGQRWLGRYPQAVLCDFGIALDLRYPVFSKAAATRSYAAPEQILYGGHDPSQLGYFTDIFQWGVVVYQMITGELPFGHGPTGLIDERYAARSMSEYRRVPHELNELVLKALAKNPAYRLGSADQIVQALEQIQRYSLPQAIVLGGLVLSVVVGSLAVSQHLLPIGDGGLEMINTPSTTTVPQPAVSPSVMSSEPVIVPASVMVTSTTTLTPTAATARTRRPTSTMLPISPIRTLTPASLPTVPGATTD